MKSLEDLISITSILALLIAMATIYLKSYLSEKGKHLASREEFQQLRNSLIENTKATETIKHTLQRKFDVRTNASNELFSCLAEIESGIIHWQLLIYFRKLNLPSGTPIEELGRQDLAETAQLLMKYNRILSRYSIYFSKDISDLANYWGVKIYNLLFDLDAIYKTSLEYHMHKQVSDEEKMNGINDLLKLKIHHKIDEIRLIKTDLSNMLREYLDLNS